MRVIGWVDALLAFRDHNMASGGVLVVLAEGRYLFMLEISRFRFLTAADISSVMSNVGLNFGFFSVSGFDPGL
jgi:hypothetical protein